MSAKRFDLYLLIIYIIQYSYATEIPEINEYIIEDLTVTKEPDEDHLNQLKLSMFGKPYTFNLEPADSIFSPYYQTLSKAHVGSKIWNRNYLEPQKEELSGSFYTDVNGRGSFYIEKENNQIRVTGFVDDFIGISYLSGRHVATKSKIKQIVDRIINRKSPEKIDLTVDNGLEIDLLTIEVLILLDPIVANDIKTKNSTIKKYLGIFWNEVQNKYKVFTNPEVKISLAGVYTLDEMLWMNDTFIEPNKPDGELFLEKFGYWIYEKHNTFPNFDVAALHTGFDLCSPDEEDKKKIGADLLGIAFFKGICESDPDVEVFPSVLLVEDTFAPLPVNALTAAHELGHLLHAGHDDPEQCGSNSIMSSDEQYYTPSTFKFSSCSMTEIYEALRSNNSTCLRNSPIPQIPINIDMPVMSRTQLCQTAFNIKYYAVEMDLYKKYNVNESLLCKFILCSRKESKDIKYVPWVPEKTPCGQDKLCIKGVCTKITT